MALFMTLAGAMSLVVAIGAFIFMDSNAQLPFIAVCTIGGLLLIGTGHLNEKLEQLLDRLPRK